MTSIYQQGFLSGDMHAWIARIRGANSLWFQFCDDLNQFCQQTLFSIKVHEEDRPRAFALVLFIRILRGFQSVVILSERGLVKEAEVLLRALLDALFVLGALEKDPAIYDELIHDSNSRFLKDLNRIRHRTSQRKKKELMTFLPNLDDHLDQLIENVKSRLHGKKPKTISREHLASKAGHFRLYAFNYALLSTVAHADATDLHEHLNLDDRGKISSVKWGPDFQAIGSMLMNAAEYLLLSLFHISPLCRLDIESHIEVFKDRFQAIAQLTPQQINPVKKENELSPHG